MVIEVTHHRAWWHDVELRLTRAQFVILMRLARAGGAVVSLTDLAACVYPGEAGYRDDGRVRAHLKRLRRVLQAAHSDAATSLETVRGVGMRLVTPPHCPPPRPLPQ